MKILENFSPQSTGNCRKMQPHQDLRNDFHWAGKIKQAACKTLCVWTKMKKILKNFNRNFRFLIKIAMQN